MWLTNKTPEQIREVCKRQRTYDLWLARSELAKWQQRVEELEGRESTGTT